MADRKTSKDAKEEPAAPKDTMAGPAEAKPADESLPAAEAEPTAEAEIAAEADAAEPEAEPEAEPAAEAEPASTPPIAPPPAPERLRPSRGGFFGTVIGGIIAAVIGFGAARYVLPQGWPFGPTVKVTDTLAQRLDAADASVAALKTQVADLDKAVKAAQGQATAAADLGSRIDKTNAAIATLKGDLAKTEDGLKQSLDSLDSRITALEKLPVASGQASGNADAAVLASLRAQLEQQRKQNASLAAEIKSVGEKANARIDAAEKQAQALKAEADAASKGALARAALTQVQAALNLGGGFAPALSALKAQGVAVPVTLAKAADAGVPTEADLAQAFPAASRTALDASIKATMGKGFANRLSAFLRTQTGLRSLKPRPGNDPDAVLSRAEADLRAGKLSEALKEIATLPEPGQKAMADWVGMARARLDALKAADTLAQSLGK